VDLLLGAKNISSALHLLYKATGNDEEMLLDEKSTQRILQLSKEQQLEMIQADVIIAPVVVVIFVVVVVPLQNHVPSSPNKNDAYQQRR
jgi:hypothetical protein